MNNLYIIAGPNGSGKTTASYTILPEMLNCNEFVNADEIAKGLSPFQPETTAIQAGKLMIERIHQLIKKKSDFAFETTLASRHFVHTINKAKENKYFVTLIFLWLNSPELASERVKERIKEGGHAVPENIIYRRYFAGLKNLSTLYIPISDYWIIIDNSSNPFEIIADGNSENKQIANKKKWMLITKNIK